MYGYARESTVAADHAIVACARGPRTWRAARTDENVEPLRNAIERDQKLGQRA
jgi:hypothetical protein